MHNTSRLAIVSVLVVVASSASQAASRANTQAVALPSPQATSPATSGAKIEQELIALSKDKWRWMSERNVEALAALFHDDAVFVHMGATMSKTQELGVIKGGSIQYKTVEIQDVSVKVIGTTAILLNRIRLVAEVGGNEVTNPFVVTEVYVQQGGSWKLGSLSFTRLQTSMATFTRTERTLNDG